MPAEGSITNEQKVKITLNPTTQGEHPAPIENATCSVIDGNATVEPVEGDDHSFYLISGDDPGDTTFLIEADAQIGEGEENIQDTVLLHVVGAHAAHLGTTFGSPEPKDTPEEEKKKKKKSKDSDNGDE